MPAPWQVARVRAACTYELPKLTGAPSVARCELSTRLVWVGSSRIRRSSSAATSKQMTFVGKC